jgi:hypothetical protein
MRYAMLIYTSDRSSQGSWSPEEAAKRSEESLPKWYAFFEELGKADPEMKGKELDDIRTAKTVRVRDGEVLITDGPYAETKEQILGFYIVDLDSQDDVVEFARELAAVNPGGAYEIRPVIYFAANDELADSATMPNASA